MRVSRKDIGAWLALAALVALLAGGCATGPAAPSGEASGSAVAPAVVAPPDLADATVRVEDQTYTGLELTPGVEVVLDGETLGEGTDYELAYRDNTEIGTATVTVTAMGEYTGEIEASFEIEPHPEGWDSIDGTAYYFTAEGVRAASAFVPGTDGSYFYVGEDGTVVTSSWIENGGAYYYIAASGRPVTNGWATAGGKYVYLGNDGTPLQYAWVEDGGERFYCGAGGVPVTGLQTIDGEAYIFNSDGTLRYISRSERLDRIVCRLIRDRFGFDLRAPYEYIAYEFDYKFLDVNTSYAGWEEDVALNLYDEGAGNCYSMAAMYHFFLRAMGYDSKVIDGIASFRNGKWTGAHSWVEVYIDGSTYVCDPALENYYWYSYPNYFTTYSEVNNGTTSFFIYEV